MEILLQLRLACPRFVEKAASRFFRVQAIREDERRERSAAKLMAHVGRGDDCSLAALLAEAKVSEEVVQQLVEAGVDDFERLITVVSRGDHHEIG